MTATTLRLYGPMGVRFGREHRFVLDSGKPAEALRALISQVSGVREYLMNAKAKGIEFAVFVGKRNLSEDHLRLPANGEIRIAPIPAGAKRGGVLNIIVGVVLLAISYFVPVTAPYLAPIGWGLIVGGVIQLLTPLPHGNSAKDGPDNQPNYNFNGAINTQAQGNPVPLAYGRVKCGSAVISAGIDTVDTSISVHRGNPHLGFMGGGGWGGIGNPRIDPDLSP